MKKTIKKLTITSLILLFVLSLSKVYASNDLKNIISNVEYSENYKKYLNLSDEEKTQVLEPLKYDVKAQQDNTNYLKSINNPLKTFQLLKSSFTPKYSLQNTIPENVKIRNQMSTNSCWAFAYMGVLESNLGLNDYLSSKPSTIYDFSEKHMNYSTARAAFKNNEINSSGFTRELKDGGTYLMALSYLSNGNGAIAESELAFENSEAPIDISEIKNKTVCTTVSDINIFAQPTSEDEKKNLILSMKEHISNYGGIFASVYGSTLLSDNYNNATGAMYCNNSTATPANHAVTIIGWDDTYSKDNFNEKCKPENDGAWIIKNSWGETQTENLSKIKITLYNENTAYCNSNNWNSAQEIPADFVLSNLQKTWGNKVSIDEATDTINLKIGNNGYMYISYDDINVYQSLSGIQKASSKKDYYNIYQNDILGPSTQVSLNSDEIYLANVFTRNSNITEALNKISIFTLSDVTCEVLINPNNSDKSLTSLQKVKLTTGDTQKITPGYHTIEFETPITLTGSSFTVVVKISNNTNKQCVLLESKQENTFYANAIVNSGESYFSTSSDISNNMWQDFATIENADFRGNLCIKAFTTSDILSNTQPDNNNPNTTPDNPDNSNSNTTPDNSDNSNSNTTPDSPDNSNSNTTPDNSESTPTPSNLTNTSAEISDGTFYFYTKNLENSRGKMKIKISKIQIGSENDTYTYKYYLSGKKGEENISSDKWKEVKIQKENDGTYSIIIDVSSNDLNTNIDLAKSDNLYVYIKETAVNGNKSVENIHTIEAKSSSDAEQSFYLDDKKVDNLESILEIILNNVTSNNQNNTNNQNTLNTSVDKTIANKILPFTGIVTISIIIILFLIIGLFSYYKYKNILK